MKKLFALLLFVSTFAFGQSYPSPTYNVLTLQTPLAVLSGGTGNTTAAAELTRLGAAPAANPTFTGTVTATTINTTNITATNATAAAINGLPQYSVLQYGALCNGTTNDATAIQSAITAAQAAGGGVVLFPQGKACAVSSTLTITQSNIGFLCPTGGYALNDLGAQTSFPTGGCVLKWTGSSGGTIASIIAPTGSTSNNPLHGNSMIGMSFDGNSGLAANGVILKTVDSGYYHNLAFLNFNGGNTFTLTTVQPTAGNFNPLATADSQLNIFDGISIQALNNGSAGASNGFLIGAYAGGGALTVNASENTFSNMSIFVGPGATGILCQGCDTNHFTSISIGNLGGSAPAIDLSIEVDGANSYPANSNVFDGLVTGNAVTARGQTTFATCTTGFQVPPGSCTNGNVINNLDDANGTPTPIIEPGAQLTWRTTAGFSKGMVFGPLVVGGTAAPAITASPLVTNESLRIVNGASNHIVLSDNTAANVWGIDIDGSNNLRFVPLTGTSGVVAVGAALTATSFPSPSLTGVPTAPNAAAATNTTQIATTAFVQGVLQSPPGGIGTVTPAAGVFTTLKANTSTSLVNLVSSGTAPTIASGFGTSPSITASNGTAAFEIHIGTGGTVSSGALTMPTATNGWVCDAQDISTVSASVFQTKQIATTATSVTFQNYSTAAVPTAWTAGDNLVIKCSAF
jgi:hypothetical protein